MKNIIKDFPGVRALNKVSFTAVSGEIHSLVGENGAGKSTLMKILSGVYPYSTYEGEIIINDKPSKFHNTRDAEEKGIAIIYQELNLVQNLSVGENIFLGREPTKGLGLIDWRKLNQNAKEVLSTLEVDLNPQIKVSSLGIGKQQLVEIAKALSKNSQFLILDEPTSALTDTEVKTLFKILRLLKEKGKVLIYISHKLDEVFKISDRITVLRDGQTVGTFSTEEISRDRLVSLMVGRKITTFYPKKKVEIGEVLLEVKNFNVNHPFLPGEKIVKNINLKLREGEILGIAGLMGSGRSELVTGIFGAFPSDIEGEVYVKGKRVKINSPRQAIREGIALLTEDRKRFGLILILSVGKNITLSCLDKLSRFNFINNKKEKDLISKYIDELKIKTQSEKIPVSNLSGGNQQKVVFSKWIANEPKVLFLDEPTRGVDVGAKVEIYQIMNELVKKGMGIIMVSSDLPEVLSMSDRIIVMREGEITAEFKAEEATQEKIMKAATHSLEKGGET